MLMQKNWIGKSEGALINFEIEGQKDKIIVFTTRPDTIYGVTYLVLSPEHEYVKMYTPKKNIEKVKKYCQESELKSEMERLDTKKSKTGVFSGLYAINPLSNRKVPIWIADYVLIGYGSGAIMAVPGHDERDYEFAKKYDIEIMTVVKSKNNISNSKDDLFIGNGISINSDLINGLETNDAKNKIISLLEEKGLGNKFTNYKLKDWLISRQRY